ncbi:MAG: oligosaccharide flippase family protein [Corynebacteriales bacterium]|nr:oligosaccharide flippase family protein [Mycobacteriales bacterium]
MTSPNEVAKIARSGGVSFAGAVIGALGGFALVVLVSRGLGASGAGVFSLLVAVFMTLTVAGRLGVDSALVRLLPRLRVQGRVQEITSTVIAALVPVTIAMTVGAAGLWVLADEVSHWLTETHDNEQLLRIVAALLPLNTAGYVALAATRGLGSVRPLVLVENILKPCLRCALVGVALLWGSGVFGVTVAWAFASVLGTGIAGLALYRALRLIRAAEPPATGNVENAGLAVRELWGFAVPRAGAQICEILGLHVGIVLAGLLGNTADAGVYNAVLRLVLAGTLALQALRIAIAPQLSRLVSSGEHEQAQLIHHASTTWVVLISWPAYVLMAAWPQQVLSLFGTQFDSGAGPLRILALAMLVNLATGNVGTVLLMSGRSGANALIAVGSLILQIGGALLLAPWLGVFAVVIAKAAAIVAENLIMENVVRTGEKLTTLCPSVWRAMGLAVLCFGVPACALQMAGVHSFAVACVSAVSAAAVYIGAIYRLRSLLHCEVFVTSLRRPRVKAAATPLS